MICLLTLSPQLLKEQRTEWQKEMVKQIKRTNDSAALTEKDQSNALKYFLLPTLKYQIGDRLVLDRNNLSEKGCFNVVLRNIFTLWHVGVKIGRSMKLISNNSQLVQNAFCLVQESGFLWIDHIQMWLPLIFCNFLLQCCIEDYVTF